MAIPFLVERKNMTVKQCIDIVDGVKPNTYSEEDKVRWLSIVEAMIFDEVINTHYPVESHVHDFEGYSPDHMDRDLYVRFPHDVVYEAFLKMKIDEENCETARYNNSALMFNSLYEDFKKSYNKNHMPISGQLKIF